MIHLEGLTKRYKKADRNAVDGISFDVRAGEFFTLSAQRRRQDDDDLDPDDDSLADRGTATIDDPTSCARRAPCGASSGSSSSAPAWT